MQIKIESYSASFQDGITGLITGIQQNEFGIPITLADQPDLLSIAAFYQDRKGNFWIARIGGEVVGTIALLDIGNNQGALRKMFVKKDFRGKDHNIAQQLLTTLISWAREHGFAEIILGTTEKFIAAQRFYEKNGFTEIQKTYLPAAFPVMAVDIKFYRLAVPPKT